MPDRSAVEIEALANGMKRSVKGGISGLGFLELTVDEFVHEGMWRDFRANGVHYWLVEKSVDLDPLTYHDFRGFCDVWLDVDYESLLQLFKPRSDSAEVERERARRLDILKAAQGEDKVNATKGGNNNPEGRNQHHRKVGQVDNVNLTRSKGGNSAEYTLKRLKRGRPDLHAKVLDGELSCNAAAIEAGFRKKPSKGVELIKREVDKLEPSELNEVIEYINSIS